jgi:DNA-binding transcriptional LysR family regulator
MVDLVDTDSATVAQMVESGQADLGFASPPQISNLNFAPAFEDTVKLVCKACCDLTFLDRPLEWQDLDQASLILNETTRGIATPAFAALALRTKLRVRNVASLLGMVQAGIGVTILPGLATISLPPTLVALPLADLSCRRQVGLITRQGSVQSPLATLFQIHLWQKLPPLAQSLNLRTCDSTF